MARAAGVKGIELSDRLAFDSYILAQEAAIEGRGLAMTIGPFATDEIKAGPARSAFPADGAAPPSLAVRLRPKTSSSPRSGASRTGW